jgi:hypothetical protein
MLSAKFQDTTVDLAVLFGSPHATGVITGDKSFVAMSLYITDYTGYRASGNLKLHCNLSGMFAGHKPIPHCFAYRWGNCVRHD